MLNITEGPPLKRQQPLCRAIKHPLGRVPVACQLFTLLVAYPVRELVLSDELKDVSPCFAVLFCCTLCAWMFRFFSWVAISHTVATKQRLGREALESERVLTCRRRGKGGWLWHDQPLPSPLRGAAGGDIGNVRVYRRMRIWKSQVLLKRNCWWSAEL